MAGKQAGVAAVYGNPRWAILRHMDMRSRRPPAVGLPFLAALTLALVTACGGAPDGGQTISPAGSTSATTAATATTAPAAKAPAAPTGTVEARPVVTIPTRGTQPPASRAPQATTPKARPSGSSPLRGGQAGRRDATADTSRTGGAGANGAGTRPAAAPGRQQPTAAPAPEEEFPPAPTECTGAPTDPAACEEGEGQP